MIHNVPSRHKCIESVRQPTIVFARSKNTTRRSGGSVTARARGVRPDRRVVRGGRRAERPAELSIANEEAGKKDSSFTSERRKHLPISADTRPVYPAEVVTTLYKIAKYNICTNFHLVKYLSVIYTSNQYHNPYEEMVTDHTTRGAGAYSAEEAR